MASPYRFSRLQRVADEQRVALDALVGHLQAGIGVVDGAHAQAGAAGELVARPQAILEMKRRTHVPPTHLGTREHRDADADLDERARAFPLAIEPVDEHGTER